MAPIGKIAQGRASARGLRGLVLGGAALVATAGLLPAPARADTLTTTDGRTFEGKIIERTDAGVTFEVMSGRMRGRLFFDASQIATLEVGLSPAEKRQQAYEAKKKTLDLTAAAGWYQLGLWCAGEEMYEEAVGAFERSVTLDAAYQVRSTLARARMEVGRERLRTARDLLAPLAAARPGEAEVQAELAQIQQRINADLTSLLETGRLAYQRKDYPLALGCFRRVAEEADAALLADLARRLAEKNEPSLAEMMVGCRLSEALVDRPGTFDTATALEKPLLLERLRALVEAGVRAAEAAYGALAARTGGDVSEQLAATQRELAAIDRFERLAGAGQGLARDLENEAARSALGAAAAALAQSRARLTLLWIDTLEASTREALAKVTDDSLSFDDRVKAGDTARDLLKDALASLGKLAAGAVALPDAAAARLLATRRRLEDLDRQLRDARDHLQKLDTALDRGLRALERKQPDDIVLWFSRLVEEANPREGRALEDLVRRRTGRDLVDVLVTARIELAQKEKRFREATRYDRAALDRELSRQASQLSVRATEALRQARAAAPGSEERRAAARRAIAYADETILFLQGRRDIGTNLSRGERDRIADDINEMQFLISQARQLLLTTAP